MLTEKLRSAWPRCWPPAFHWILQEASGLLQAGHIQEARDVVARALERTDEFRQRHPGLQGDQEIRKDTAMLAWLVVMRRDTAKPLCQSFVAARSSSSVLVDSGSKQTADFNRKSAVSANFNVNLNAALSESLVQITRILVIHDLISRTKDFTSLYAR